MEINKKRFIVLLLVVIVSFIGLFLLPMSVLKQIDAIIFLLSFCIITAVPDIFLEPSDC